MAPAGFGAFTPPAIPRVKPKKAPRFRSGRSELGLGSGLEARVSMNPVGPCLAEPQSHTHMEGGVDVFEADPPQSPEALPAGSGPWTAARFHSPNPPPINPKLENRVSLTLGSDTTGSPFQGGVDSAPTIFDAAKAAHGIHGKVASIHTAEIETYGRYGD